jgi:hypothetical protein
MSIHESRGTLSDATKELFARWNDIQTVWHDAQSQEFEKTYLEPLQLTVRNALKAMEQLNLTLQTIKSDCQ